MTRYRIIAETSFDAPTNADAKSWFADLIDMDAAPFGVEISAEEESAKPHLGPDHPAARCAHALLDAQSELSQWTKQDEQGKVRALVTEALDAHAALYLLFIRAEREIASLITCNKRLESINTALVQQHMAARETAQALVTKLAARPLTLERVARPMSVTP